MVESTAVESGIAELEAELKRASDEEAALAQQFDTTRSQRIELDQQLAEAREEVSRLMLAAAKRESEMLVSAAEERLRTAQPDSAGGLAEAATDYDAFLVRLQRMEARCDELRATVALIAEIASEAVEAIPGLRQRSDRAEVRPAATPPDGRQLVSGDGAELGASEAGTMERQDTTSELAIIIDDRDSRRPRRKGWLSFNRENRESAERRARHDAAIADRINRVLGPATSVATTNPEEVEARIRNMSHGTNGE